MSDVRYQFITTLCQAIETFSQETTENNPNAFIYRDINLQFAIERFLYFDLVDNQRLYQYFYLSEQDQLPNVIYVRREIEKIILTHIFKLEKISVIIRKHPLYFLYEGRKQAGFWKRLIQWNLTPSPTISSRLAEILIWISQVKHSRFLNPITEALNQSFAYLLITQREYFLKPYLIQKKLPYIDTVGLTINSKNVDKNYSLKLFPEVLSYCDRLLTVLPILQPKCMVLVEGNLAMDEVTNQVCRFLKIPTVCIQHGWSPIIHNGFRNMSYTKMLVWGQGFADLLHPYNSQQNFILTGNHVLKLASQKSSFKNKLPQQGISFFLQAPIKLASQDAWQKMLKFLSQTISTFPDYPILIREHPSYPLSKQEKESLPHVSNVHFVPSQKYTLIEVLDASCIAVSIFSSTILESIAANVIPIVFNVTSLPCYIPNIHDLSVGIEVQDINSGITAIQQLLNNKSLLEQYIHNMDQFKQYYFGDNKTSSITKIVKEITNYK